MIEDTKKDLNASLTANVEDSNDKPVTSDYIIKGFELIQQGLPVYLLSHGTNVPYQGSNGHLDATVDTYQLTDMFKEYSSDSNIGIRLSGMGLIVLDIDRHNENQNGLRSLKQAGINTNFDSEVFESTPRNGFHVFYKVPMGFDIKAVNHNPLPGVEVLTDKVTVAPSVKNVDDQYIAYKHFGKDIVEASIAPKWLLDLATDVPTSGHKRGSSKARYSIQERWEMVLNGFTEGERNVQALSLAGYLLRIDIDPNIAYEIVGSVNERSKSPLTEKELDTVYLHAYKAEEKRRLGGVHA